MSAGAAHLTMSTWDPWSIAREAGPVGRTEVGKAPDLNWERERNED